MIKELKYLFYILIIFIFILLTLQFYFSDDNKKKSYRSFKEVDEKVINHSKKLILLKSDTNSIIQYVKKNENNSKKNYSFWKLITNNE